MIHLFDNYTRPNSPRQVPRGHTATSSHAEADHLELLLPSNTVTYKKNRYQTTIDLVWGTPQLADRLVKYQARQDWWSSVDHIPILTELSLSLPPAPHVVRRDWANTDWKLYSQIVTTQLRENMSHVLATPIIIDRAAKYLIDALTEATEAATLKKTIPYFSKPGYMVEMK